MNRGDEALAILKASAMVGAVAVAIFLAGSSGAMAAMQVPSALTLHNGQAIPITFWAQPYPYRYTPSRKCPLVRVETPYGWYKDRVCAAVVRRAY